MKTYSQALTESELDLIDAKYLLVNILGENTHAIGLTDKLLTEVEYTKFIQLVEMRKSGKPVDLIIGSRGFYNGEFLVTEDVLSPRPDTETLIELVIKHAHNPSTILDCGTGSGCILISLLMHYENCTGVGLDISDKALIVARENANKNGVDKRVEFIISDWFENLKSGLNFKVNDSVKFDVITSNPPYISSGDILGLDVEVQNYDPIIALDGGDDGLDCYHILASVVQSYLSGNGLVAVEFGIGQSSSVLKIFEDNGFECIDNSKDLGGIDRVQAFKLKTKG